MIDPKYQSKMVKNCIDIQKIEKKVLDSGISSKITNQITKQSSTKQHINKNETKRVKKQIDKLQELPPGVTLQDTLPIDTTPKLTEGNIGCPHPF
jgi:hypothetical protein